VLSGAPTLGGRSHSAAVEAAPIWLLLASLGKSVPLTERGCSIGKWSAAPFLLSTPDRSQGQNFKRSVNFQPLNHLAAHLEVTHKPSGKH
jgi:hypothetical protein